jgi:hypothetical protein
MYGNEQVSGLPYENGQISAPWRLYPIDIAWRKSGIPLARVLGMTRASLKPPFHFRPPSGWLNPGTVATRDLAVAADYALDAQSRLALR